MIDPSALIQTIIVNRVQIVFRKDYNIVRHIKISEQIFPIRASNRTSKALQNKICDTIYD